MDTVTLSKQNRLFWLGRYSERVYTTIQYMLGQYDRLIDGDEIDYHDFCRRIGIVCRYQNSENFIESYLFDPENPDSIRSGMDAMLGNGMVLRETISTPTLAYLQMACSAMELASRSDGPCVELQWVLDDIMAFRGSFDDSVTEEFTRNITKTAASLERISLMLRLDWHMDCLERELHKLVNRLPRTGLSPDQSCLESINRYLSGTDHAMDPMMLLPSVEGLFRV